MKKVDITCAGRLDTIKEYYFSAKNKQIAELKAGGRDIVALGIGSPDLPPPPSVVEALYASALRPDVHGYQPYHGSDLLRGAFAEWYKKWYGVDLNPKNEILPLLGSKEGIVHICMTFLQEGDQALIPNPGYPTYNGGVTLAGAQPVPYALKRENGYYPDFDALEKMDLSRVKLMICNYPNMPTGTVPTVGLFEKLVAFAARHNILLIHDNPYSFVRNDLRLSILSVEGAKDVAMELNSLSKGHSMAGWRVGSLAGRADWISDVLRFKSNMDSGMFFPVQAAAAVALSLGHEWFTELNTTYYAREKEGFKLLDALGCAYRKDQAGLFIWADLPDSFKGDGFEFSDMVLEKAGVFVVPGGVFGKEGTRNIRISLCVPADVLAKATAKVISAKI
ncbi:MAG: aminotransferase class I/II-fold pyridoxal phosphate-dependent enzyme [Alistipes sp.]|jgi:aspartate/methionine/tyrosine aminotransferase|nr:aminotransferase class I/II-fold pyridoxal phosphate-dependent enzyme [Alistipes sp.]